MTEKGYQQKFMKNIPGLGTVKQAPWDLTGNQPWEARKGQRDHFCPLHTSGQAVLAGRQQMPTTFLKAVVRPFGLLLQGAGRGPGLSFGLEKDGEALLFSRAIGAV